MSSEPLDEIQWKSPEWIQQFGLHTGNVLEYFTESPFFDRTSNNQVLKMQLQFQQIPPLINPITYFQTKLSEMIGVEFVIAYVKEPDFWIIRKQKRFNQLNSIPQQDYYIIGANIYQAPKIFDLLSSRLLSSVLSIKKSLELSNKLSNYSISDGGHQYSSFQTNLNNINDENDVSTSMLISNSNSNTYTAATTTTTPALTNPQTATSTGGLTVANNSNNNSSNTEILSGAFDGLLRSIINSNNETSIYLDDIPLYGKGSTVELMSLKVNLDE